MDIETARREAEAPVSASRAQIEGSARDLAEAFADDPIFDWFMRADARRPAARLRFFEVLLKEVAFPDGRIQRPAVGGAAAVWIPSEKLGPKPILSELRVLPMLLSAAGLARFRRLLSLRKAIDGHHPLTVPHEYLWFLGVTPSAQGHGLGSRLLKAETDRLDGLGRAGFLETANVRNLPLYQRYGFRTVDEYRAAPDGPPTWAMWRDPIAAG